MSEGYNQLESAHPEMVINRVNEIADVLSRSGTFRFSISQENLESVINIEKGEITSEIIEALVNLTKKDDKTTIEITNGSIRVSSNRLA